MEVDDDTLQLIAKILHTEAKSGSCLRQLCHVTVPWSLLTQYKVHVVTRSCEPARTSAYSEDLQWRMIWQSELLGYSQQPIAQNLGVDQSTVSRTIQLFDTDYGVCR